MGHCQRRLFEARGQGDSRLGNIHGKSARSENGQEGAVGGSQRCQPAEFFGRCTRPICSGFSWGPVDKVPRPSLATRDENITRLTYFRDRLPTNELRDTEEIALEVCKNEGLQQIIGISRLLSETEVRDRVQAIPPKACVDTESQRSQSKEL